MRVLVLGNLGSMGQRYMAVLNYLCHDISTYDPALDPEWVPGWLDMDGVIIASPTRTHIDWLTRLHAFKGPILCEKPISLDAEAIRLLPPQAGPRHMVSNWRYIPGMGQRLQSNDIRYHYYNCGGESLEENMFQPIMLADPVRSEIDLTAPVFLLLVNDNLIRLEEIQQTYVDMVSDWCHGVYDKLWTLEDSAVGADIIAGGHYLKPNGGPNVPRVMV